MVADKSPNETVADLMDRLGEEEAMVFIVAHSIELRSLLKDILDAFYCRNGKDNTHLLDAIERADRGSHL